MPRLTPPRPLVPQARYEPVSVEWAPGFQFLRAGRSGDHKAELDGAMVERFMKDAEEVAGKEIVQRFCLQD